MSRMSAPRPAEEAAALTFAHRLAEDCFQRLGDSLLSVILHGSLTFGDYVSGHSDIDLLAIVDHALSDSEIDSLTRAVTAQRAEAPGPVDLRFVTHAVAASPPIPPPLELYIRDAQLARWQSFTDDAPYAALMVLTACRIWRFNEERLHCSKTAAGTWALSRDPSLDAVRDALRRRTGDQVAIPSAQIARLLELVRARIAMS